MSIQDNGGPAFPRDHASDGHNGMTLRDYFAAKALQGCFAYWAQVLQITRQDLGDPDPVNITRLAYEYADAMLKARQP